MRINLTDNDIVDPDELLEVVDETYIEDCKDEAFAINRLYGQYLMPNPAGIYTKQSLYPVIRPDMRVYSATTGKRISIADIANEKQGVLDSSGRLCITARQLAGKDTLSMNGYYPVTAMRLIGARITQSLYSYSRVLVPQTLATNTIVYMGDAPIDEIDEYLDFVLGSKLGKIEEWVCKDLWRIYTTSIDRCAVRIEKRMDYRIYDWHRREYDKRHPELWE